MEKMPSDVLRKSLLKAPDRKRSVKFLSGIRKYLIPRSPDYCPQDRPLSSHPESLLPSWFHLPSIQNSKSTRATTSPRRGSTTRAIHETPHHHLFLRQGRPVSSIDGTPKPHFLCKVNSLGFSLILLDATNRGAIRAGGDPVGGHTTVRSSHRCARNPTRQRTRGNSRAGTRCFPPGRWSNNP